MYLTPWEAALGTKVDIKTIDEEISIIIPAGAETGEIFKLDEKGYFDGQGKRGKLVAEVKIMIPKKMSKEEQKLFEKLNSISKFNPRKYHSA